MHVLDFYWRAFGELSWQHLSREKERRDWGLVLADDLYLLILDDRHLLMVDDWYPLVGTFQLVLTECCPLVWYFISVRRRVFIVLGSAEEPGLELHDFYHESFFGFQLYISEIVLVRENHCIVIQQ